ncbi:hypothetical protein AUEXF2481DRAFT_27577 [Aureobasidium subglaciale EXF-2481]|uniref:DUF7730 domain-containing protein n=1 Tax=Aureobasidium subglaciale (strain EXF-2481) TaxID=1043005 RepID=A0A074YMK6_AURSE|nr:uncharacterized protein AUEXF2481DRAFT_27577 [Aureobasidium subglaciale EXF-2481]KAI5206008.1 hypothetical protein E4T38_04033 [Aureobasidium subglaciale]KAI5224835.1 hypothetical protein E4T40_03808 [Aureobasidium subglaciale]KAI5227888.1 hypothetical protein E4T41_04028 [Aureobasidium subglaciale]KAI5263546.1 hypothetical protein E4T46_03649 [Aureobasidium subglaciale]KEQ97319.1 hypothetical protein AUEXF2481DRAFT_27577 [Aureobasidium subglaciale EXF-2481]
MSAPISQSLFLRLPPELRLDIYRQLLIHNPHCAPANSKPTFLPTSIDYHGGHHTAIEHPEPDAVALCIRAEDPAHYKLRAAKHVRSAFIVRSGGLRPGCVPTTYFCVSNTGIHTAILRANAQIHAEACQVLYSNHVFDFDMHIEALVAFLADLTPFACSCIRSLRLVKRALPYEKEYSKAEWATAMEWLGRLRSLKSLTLGIVAGRPGQDGWETVPALRSADFDVLKGTEGMEWIEELLAINGLDNIEVEAIVVHCPFPRSAAMARYIQFSASVDDGSFAVWLKDNMA